MPDTFPRPRIADIALQLANCEHAMKLGQPLEAAFPRLKRLGQWDGLLEPFRASVSLLNWIWLQTHNGLGVGNLQTAIDDCLYRGMAVHGIAQGTSFRHEHGLLLLSAAVFHGNGDLINKVAEIAGHAAPSTDQNQFWAAMCGILKFRLLGDANREREQFDHYATYRGKEPMLRPAKRAFTDAFVKRNTKAMQRQVLKVAEDFWKRLESGTLPRVGTAPIQRRVVNLEGTTELGPWDSNRYWPWPEAVMIKLMKREGHSIRVDGFWIPEQLVAP